MKELVQVLNEIGRGQLAHMAWANHQVFQVLVELPSSALEDSSNYDDWTVARIANHLVSAAGRLAARADQAEFPNDVQISNDPQNMKALAELISRYDARLLEIANGVDGEVEFQLRGKVVQTKKSVILMQAIHHAQEHRVQISGVLASNGNNLINLDELSFWKFFNIE